MTKAYKATTNRSPKNGYPLSFNSRTRSSAEKF